jgi:hypothetical protein
MLEGAKGIDDVKEYPSLEEARAAWKDVGALLSRHIADLEASDLEKPAAFACPIEGGSTLLGCLTFLVQHTPTTGAGGAAPEGYLGLEAMSYE